MNKLNIHFTGLIAFGRRSSGSGPVEVAALVNQSEPPKKPLLIEAHKPRLWLGEVDNAQHHSLKGCRVKIEPLEGSRGTDSIEDLTQLSRVGAGSSCRNDIFAAEPNEKLVAAHVEIDGGSLEVDEYVYACFKGEEREPTQIEFARTQQKPPQRIQPTAEVVTWTLQWTDNSKLRLYSLKNSSEIACFTELPSDIWITNSPDEDRCASCCELRGPGKENAHFFAYQKLVHKGKHYYPDAIVAHIPLEQIALPPGIELGPRSVNNRPMCPPVRF